MKRLQVSRWMVMALVLALTACANSPGPRMAWVMPGSDAGELSEMLARYDWLARQPVEEQKREFSAAQAAYDKEANETSRLRLALALSLPQAPWRDDARVVALLAEGVVVGDTRPTLQRQTSQLLYRLIMERQRLIKEEQRRTEAAQNDQKRFETQAHDEHKRAEDLQQKLDALREIDRNAIKPARR